VNRWAPHPLTLRQVQYVVAVAEHRSFRRAAEVCAVAQPSLSAQVAALEDALGVRIFERLPRGVVVTEPGAAARALPQAGRALGGGADEHFRKADPDYGARVAARLVQSK
jgi:LysR family hydrogen peroxide-inducible transcriptional activator